MNRTVVIDANIGVGLFVPLVYSPRIRELWDEWQAGPSVIVVPTLWHYEVLSSMRKAVATGLLNSTDAPAIVSALALLALQEMTPEWNTALRVLEWTERLGQPVAYDAVYVELADRMQAELWTADRRLAVSARSVGLEWVHHVDDRLPTA